MATEKVDSVLKIRALGRSLHLGTLYNARDDSIVPGISLWNDEEINKKTIVCEQPSTKYDISTSDSFSDKIKLLDLSGSLKASVLVGLVDVEGSAKFLNRKTTSTRQCRVTMQYHVTTVSKKIHNVHDLIVNPDIFKCPEPRPTHVVIEVLYGADAFMEFQSLVSNESKKQIIQGNMKVMVANIPNVAFSGDGGEDKKNEEQAMTCKFNGDVTLLNNPSNYAEAVKICKDLPSQVQQKVVPVMVWLYPLSKLDDMAAKLTNEISSCVISKVEKIINDFHQAQVRTSDLIKKCQEEKLADIIRKLDEFQTSLTIYTAKFLQKLKELLPAIRGGEANETALEDQLKSLKTSSFSKEDMEDWLTGKTTEIDLVMSFIREIKREINPCEIKHPGPELELFLRSSSEDIVMFCFTSLNDEEPYLKKISFPPSISLPVQDTEISPWYNTTTQETALEVFKSEKNCEKIISFITDTDHPGISVRVYHKKKLKYKNLKLHVRHPFNYKLASLDEKKNGKSKNTLETITLNHRSAKHLRFLVCGPVGHGKSSFINSVKSVFQGRICVGALAAAESDTSFTCKYKTHQVKNKEKRRLPFVFSDLMGLENDEGMITDDIISCLGGHVRDDCEFNSLSALREQDYNKNPSVDDKVHCLLTVVSAEKIALLPGDIIKKMKEVIKHATDMGIPVAVVMTNVDRACPLVKKDLSVIHESVIKAKIEKCSEILNVPGNCILPVKNYSDEIKVDSKVDCLILRAFEQLVRGANGYIACI